MHRHPRRLVAALVCLCVTTPLFTACSGGGGKAAQSSPSPSKQDKSGTNRDDVNGDGHADVVVNGWYRARKTGFGGWDRNCVVALAAPGGLEPGAAFRVTERLPELDPRITNGPIGYDSSTQFTGDLDDDGYADVVASDMVPDPSGEYAPEQRIVWGGPDSPRGTTELPADVDRATAAGDFDGDGALDLLTLAEPNDSESAPTKPQPATVLHGPLSGDGAARTTSTTDVGYKGWAPVAHTVVGDFDGDGRDDLVTKAEYDEEDARLEEGLPEDVIDATFYRGTAKGLKPAGSVPGITNGSIPVATGDFDGDDKQDILARGQDDDQAVAVYGSDKGPGRAKARAAGLGKLKVGYDLAVGDINGDGHDDIATETRAKDPRIGEVTVVLGGKDGLSAARTITIDRHAIGLGGSPRSKGDRDDFGWDLYLADLDTDGRDELLIGTFGFRKPRKDAGYWILRGTENGPSKTDRRFVKTKDFGRS
ncbi:VCBS repeat-containing protein [Streptomyces sp. XD-27]|uniref:FG-GAP repeat domain-containing protein n=1 Tax=Streptomyces sp. XD-27 TaxID=3062779 RepID=UPI0026F46F47|nr:VCBS repeat-containing protein [Streptomyces sp. XD-27]WKX69483.1 VCBS repeat-containing protein [Streptomyces sp. XD-27]